MEITMTMKSTGTLLRASGVFNHVADVFNEFSIISVSAGHHQSPIIKWTAQRRASGATFAGTVIKFTEWLLALKVTFCVVFLTW